MRIQKACAVILVAGAVACSSSVEPSSSVTVLVTNTSCASNPCSPLRILAFPSNQPNTPGGAWSLDLGVITTPTACVRLPPTAAFYVIAEPGNDTTETFRWSTNEPVSLGAQAASLGTVVLTLTATSTFVPMSASGWSVDLPGGTKATPAAPCTP